MKFSSIVLSALVGAAYAAPSVKVFDRRQATQNDIKTGACKKITLVFARASTEPGNMGMSMGPAVCSGLKKDFGAGNVACQGVGGAYSAGLPENALPAGTTPGAITECQNMFKQTATKCPQTIIVGGGYSQGTAVMMNGISKLDASVRNRIVGVVLFGYTKNAQQKGGIPNYPKDNVKVFCSSGDGVCGGALLVTIGHFSYMGDGSGPGATKFLSAKIKAAKPGGSGEAGGAEGGEAPAAGGDAAPAAEEPAAPAKGKKSGKKGKGGARALDETVAPPLAELPVVEEESI